VFFDERLALGLFVMISMQATSLAAVDTVASATGINSVNKGTHCRAEGRVKKILDWGSPA